MRIPTKIHLNVGDASRATYAIWFLRLEWESTIKVSTWIISENTHTQQRIVYNLHLLANIRLASNWIPISIYLVTLWSYIGVSRSWQIHCVAMLTHASLDLIQLIDLISQLVKANKQCYTDLCFGFWFSISRQREKHPPTTIAGITGCCWFWLLLEDTQSIIALNKFIGLTKANRNNIHTPIAHCKCFCMASLRLRMICKTCFHVASLSMLQFNIV